MNNKKDYMVVNEDNIIDTILKLMEQVEGILDLNGVDKKVVVLNNLKSLIGDEAYERYSYFIGSFIDFVVSVSKGKTINLNNIKKKYCCF